MRTLPPKISYFVGVDLGQCRDYTAIAVVERAERIGPFDRVVFAHRKLVSLCLRFLERVPLGTPYPEVVRRVVEVAGSRGLVGRCRLAVDGAGVGRPVVDLLRAARPGCALSPVIVTGGDSETKSDGYHRVPNATSSSPSRSSSRTAPSRSPPAWPTARNSWPRWPKCRSRSPPPAANSSAPGARAPTTIWSSPSPWPAGMPGGCIRANGRGRTAGGRTECGWMRLESLGVDVFCSSY